MKLSAGKIWHLMAKVRNYAYVLLVATALSYANPYSFSNSLRHVFFIAALAAFILLFSGTLAKNRWEYFHWFLMGGSVIAGWQFGAFLSNCNIIVIMFLFLFAVTAILLTGTVNSSDTNFKSSQVSLLPSRQLDFQYLQHVMLHPGYSLGIVGICAKRGDGKSFFIDRLLRVPEIVKQRDVYIIRLNALAVNIGEFPRLIIDEMYAIFRQEGILAGSVPKLRKIFQANSFFSRFSEFFFPEQKFQSSIFHALAQDICRMSKPVWLVVDDIDRVRDEQQVLNLALICDDLIRESSGRIHVIWLYDRDAMLSMSLQENDLRERILAKYVSREVKLSTVKFAEACEVFQDDLRTYYAGTGENWSRDIQGVLRELHTRVTIHIPDDVMSYIQAKHYSMRKIHDFMADLWDTLEREYHSEQDFPMDIIGVVVYIRHFLPEAYESMTKADSLYEAMKPSTAEQCLISAEPYSYANMDLKQLRAQGDVEKYVGYYLFKLEQYEAIFQDVKYGAKSAAGWDSPHREYDRLQNWVKHLIFQAHGKSSDLDRLIGRIKECIELGGDVHLEAIYLQENIHPELHRRIMTDVDGEFLPQIVRIYSMHQEPTESYEKLFQYMSEHCKYDFRLVYEQCYKIFGSLPSEAFVIFSRSLTRFIIKENYITQRKFRAFVYGYIKYALQYISGFEEEWKQEEARITRKGENDQDVINRLDVTNMREMIADARIPLNRILNAAVHVRPSMTEFYKPILVVLNKIEASLRFKPYDARSRYIQPYASPYANTSENSFHHYSDEELEKKLRAGNPNHMIDLSDLSYVLLNQKRPAK